MTSNENLEIIRRHNERIRAEAVARAEAQRQAKIRLAEEIEAAKKVKKYRDEKGVLRIRTEDTKEGA